METVRPAMWGWTSWQRRLQPRGSRWCACAPRAVRRWPAQWSTSHCTTRFGVCFVVAGLRRVCGCGEFVVAADSERVNA